MRSSREWLWAWRQLRTQRGRGLLFIACVAVGVAARVCVGSFAGEVADALERESQSLLLADVAIQGRQQLSPERQAQLQGLLPTGAEVQHLVRTTTMAATATLGRSHIVLALGVNDGFPFYGDLDLRDAEGRELRHWPTRPAGLPVAYVQRDLLIHLHNAVGDQIRLGDRHFLVAGTIEELPGLGFGGFAIGPRVLVHAHDLKQTGLLERGSYARYTTLIKLPTRSQAEPLAQALVETWDLPDDARRQMVRSDDRGSDVLVRTYRDAEGSVRRALDQLGRFLHLVSLSALLLGGLGIAAVARSFVVVHSDTMATLRVLGAQDGTILRLFAWQLLLLTGLGCLLGTLAGLLLQTGLVAAVHGLLPVDLGMGLDPSAVVAGIVLGLVVSVSFSVGSLLLLRRLRPREIWRGTNPLPFGRRLLPGLVICVVLVLLVWWDLGSLPWALAAVGAVLLASALLWLGSGLVFRVLVLAGRRGLSFAWRHGLANLRRAGLRPFEAVLPIGLAVAILAMLLIYRASILGELDPGVSEADPSLFAINLYPEDIGPLRQIVASEGGVVEPGPFVTARLRRIGEEEITAERPAAITEGGHRLRRREQRLAFATELGSHEQLVAGDLFGADEQGASLEAEYADLIGASLGDRLTFSIFGKELSLTVTSLREVQWSSFRPSFFILVHPSTVATYPQQWVAAIVLPRADHAAELQSRIVTALPEVSVFSVASLVRRIRTLLDRVALAVSVLAVLALVAGIVVLTASINITARQRREDAALLRVLGAGRSQVQFSLLAEFLGLALAGVLGGLLLAFLASALFMNWVAEVDLVLPWLFMGGGGLVVLGVVLLAGMLASRSVWRGQPLTILRQDG